eukprot:3331373-Amphidinium_carterae.1
MAMCRCNSMCLFTKFDGSACKNLPSPARSGRQRTPEFGYVEHARSALFLQGCFICALVRSNNMHQDETNAAVLK